MSGASVRPLLEQAVAHLQASRPVDARPVLAQALQLAPSDFDVLNLSGVAAMRLGENAEAVSLLERATQLRPSHAGAFNNLGMALRSTGDNEGAAKAYRRAVALEPRYPAARTNLAAALVDMRLYEEAVEHLDLSLADRPKHPETLRLRATALRQLLMYEGALESIDELIELAPDVAQHHIERGQLLSGLDRHAEAAEAYRRALQLSPDDPQLAGLLASSQLRLCDWTDFEDMRSGILARARAGEPAITPFNSLMIFDNPQVQLQIARDSQARHAAPAVAAPAPIASKRLRVGYFSADLRNHPSTHLSGEMFALHDRDRLEVTIFSFPAGAQDEYTEQIRSEAERFIDISRLSDAEAVALARELSLDVAVDLMGNTRGARSGIFARRAAPVQINYLGYPGTSGNAGTDYILADRIIIPEDTRAYFTERVIWMPDCYTSRDTRVRVRAPTRRARAAAGLPENALVYCCFNQPNKILPEQFDDWMKILAQVEGSVLWLMDSGAAVSANLRREAKARGIDPARLVFAARLPLAQHFERLQLADLCLDTLPYNAHTTANDALFVGVPILTRSGRAFAARVCASLVTAAGMPELIVPDRAEYIARAVELGRNRAELAALRTKLAAARETAPLFDVRRFTRTIEAAYFAVHERCQAGLAPAHIAIERQ